MKIRGGVFALLVLLLFLSNAWAMVDLHSDTWVATDALGRTLPDFDTCGPVREDRVVGMFYFLWLGQHSKEGPFDITQLLDANPDNPAWGPVGAFHHWGQSELGYYLSDSPYVMRTHWSMLQDAGIDVLIFDVTNAFTYEENYLTLCDLYAKIRTEGQATPQICFLTHSQSAKTLTKLYTDFYKPGLHQDLWFQWKGKPLILGPTEGLSPEVRDFFSIRDCWAWTHGKDTWQWLDHTKDRYGWHEDAAVPEELSVSVAQHPMSNIGRSHRDETQPPINHLDLTGQEPYGHYFAEQWDRALRVDPEFVFVTGWNEWVAQRFVKQQGQAPDTFLGQPLKPGDTYFVDAYNQEYNRDIEPMLGGHGDNTYYQLVDYVRRYKGVRPLPQATQNYAIDIDGRFDDWQSVEPTFYDTRGDVAHRDEASWGNVTRYVNRTGRNDIVTSKVAVDDRFVYFHVRTDEALTPQSDPNWMLLFIDADQDTATGWQGYDYLVNGRITLQKTSLEHWTPQGWAHSVSLAYRTTDRDLEIAIPRAQLGVGPGRVSLDFHWADNLQTRRDIAAFSRDGDSAPNRRFNYRFVMAGAGLEATKTTQDQPPSAANVIQRIDLVHMTHTDIGFTDHPLVCRQQQMRYLDIAIDAVLATSDSPPDAQFYWTAETTLAVDDWWKAADSDRRKDFLTAVGTGRLEVGALAMNQTPALNASEWHAMIHWLPETLQQKITPRVAIQNDVNGFPRAGAIRLLDGGLQYLFMGINGHNGGPPFRTPSAFWWKMPDGRRLFVWLGDHYAQGFYYFHGESWRRGPVPESTDTRYRPARPGDFFRSDEASVRAAHEHLTGRLRRLEADGYAYPSLILSITNEWRMDNDPPFPALAQFVATWNRLRLKPEIHLSTAVDAMDRLKESIGDTLPEYQGEWPDWWANGTASGPREVSASRKAKRLADAALSPVWGHPNERTLEAAEDIYRDLCLFDEHTWGSVDSVGQPHSLETWAQYNEKSRAAYRPMALAKLILAQRARSAIYPREEGLYVTNPATLPWSGWVTMPASVLRGNFKSLENPANGTKTPLTLEPGYSSFGRPAGPEELTFENSAQTFPDHAANQVVRFWIEDLQGETIERFRLSEEAVPAPKTENAPTVTVDAHNWPTSARWPGMEQSLFQAGTGDILSVAIDDFSGRWVYSDIFGMAAPQKQDRRRDVLKEVVATAKEPAQVESNAHTTVYTQTLTHPRFAWATRRLEVWHHEPRARLTVRFHRTEFELPEILFVACDLPCGTTLPETSNGGMPFIPYEDQLPGSCQDYFTIDDWVQFSTDQGRWLWVSRDAPLVTFGGHQVLAGRTGPPEQPGRVLAMVFNNTWITNFVADSHGVLEFQFDMAWQPPSKAKTDPAGLARTLLVEPHVVINPKLPPDPLFLDRLHRP